MAHGALDRLSPILRNVQGDMAEVWDETANPTPQAQVVPRRIRLPDRHGRELPERTGEWEEGALSNPDSPHCQRFWPHHFRVNDRRVVLKFAPVAVGLPILDKIDNVFPKQNHGWPRTRLAVRGYSGP